jgi:hypothetical protein
MLLTDLEFAGLHFFHWLFSVLLPIIFIVSAMICLLRGRILRRSLLREIDSLSGKIDLLSGRSIKNLPAIAGYFQNSPRASFRLAFTRL